MIKLPVKKTVWGPVNSLQDLKKAISKSGQPFGVDWSGPACETIANAPCDKTYYEYLGFGLHKGIDIPVATGTEIYAAAAGKVSEISDNVTKGLGVVLYHSALKLKTVYWHLKSYTVNLGDRLKAGELIAISDNTGYSKGPHLHFEVKITDENGVSIKNVDPMPYFSINTMLDKEDVEFLQALEGFSDEAGQEFWVGKTLKEYKAARVPDKIKELQKTISQ